MVSAQNLFFFSIKSTVDVEENIETRVNGWMIHIQNLAQTLNRGQGNKYGHVKAVLNTKT